jgi:hypothetical protein
MWHIVLWLASYSFLDLWNVFILYVGLLLGGDKSVSQNWHYFEGGMNHSSKHVIPVDYQACSSHYF